MILNRKAIFRKLVILKVVHYTFVVSQSARIPIMYTYVISKNKETQFYLQVELSHKTVNVYYIS